MGLDTLKNLIKHKLLAIRPNGQYNFLTKKIYNKMDIDLATSIINTDYYKENLIPQPINYKKWKKVVVFAPHQDDEIIGCGAILNELSKINCEIDLVFLTDGRPIGENAEKIVDIRHHESIQVAKELKANLINIGINNVSLNINKTHFETILKLFKKNKYHALFTPWVLDSPPKHRLCNFLISEVLKKTELNPDFQIMTYQVHNMLIPNVYLDYTYNYNKKQELIKLYKSQLVHQNYAHLSSGLDSWNTRFLSWSPQNRYIEVFSQIPLNEYYNLIQFYKNNPEQTFKSHKKCIDSFKNIMELISDNNL